METLVKGLLPLIQQEVVRPLNTRVDNCKKEAEEMAEHFAGLVRVLEKETYGLCRRFEKFENFENFEYFEDLEFENAG